MRIRGNEHLPDVAPEVLERRTLIERAKDFFARRKTAYQIVFARDSQMAQVVLKDLARFCRAHEPTFHVDARAHALAEGRREVWLRIQEHLHLSADELWSLHGKEM